MAQSLTVRQAAADTGVHRNTEANETYLLESDKGQRNLGREPRKRGGSATKPGISDEQICVLVARDRAGQTWISWSATSRSPRPG